MPLKLDSADQSWRRTALSRLKFELAGISFARKMGLTPEDWARHLWTTCALKWMGKPQPTAAEYLLREAEAFKVLYPQVAFELTRLDDGESEMVFTGGCLGGWGKDQWAIARSLDMMKGHVCRYCREAFRAWSRQLGLESCPEPKIDGTCVLLVKTKAPELTETVR